MSWMRWTVRLLSSLKTCFAFWLQDFRYCFSRISRQSWNASFRQSFSCSWSSQARKARWAILCIRLSRIWLKRIRRIRATSKARSALCFRLLARCSIALISSSRLTREKSTFFFSDSNALTDAVTWRIWDVMHNLCLVCMCLTRPEKARCASLFMWFYEAA